MQGFPARGPAVGSSFDSGHVFLLRLDLTCGDSGTCHALLTHAFSDPLVRDHSLQLRTVGGVGDCALAQLPFSLFALGSQDVARKRMAANHLARAGLLKALGRAFMGFQLRHKMSWISYRNYQCSIIPGSLSTRRTRPSEWLRACLRWIWTDHRRIRRAR